MSWEDIEAIKALKARYFRFMDTKQWDAFAELFTADAHMDTSGEFERMGMDGSMGIVDGNQAIGEYVKASVDVAVTCHHGHMPEIELTSPTTATGIWAMFDYVDFGADGPYPGLQGYGHYHETYEKVDGQWRIASLKLTRLRVDALGG